MASSSPSGTVIVSSCGEAVRVMGVSVGVPPDVERVMSVAPSEAQSADSRWTVRSVPVVERG